MRYITGASTSDIPSQRELKNRQTAYQAALEGIVLLKNDGALPISAGKISLFGVGASMTIKGGTGSGEVNERHSVSILEGLENAGFTITTKNWIHDVEKSYEDARQERIAASSKINILNISQVMGAMGGVAFPYGRPITDEDLAESGTDTAIYVVARQAGEGADKKLKKGEFDLSPVEIDNLRKISSFYAKTILVINSGSGIDLSILDEVNISAVFYFCQQGSEGGTAFADLLLGKASPSGKLADTWVKRYRDIPFADQYSYLSGDTSREYYHEGIYVGYRYFDTFQVEPRWHFGFGLSYTSFSIRTGTVTLDKTTVSAEITVENTGTYSGKEVVQLYVSPPEGTLAKEYQRLVAFGKTDTLQPGEKQTLSVSFDMRSCASYCTDRAAYLLEAGDYILRIGSASNCTAAAAVISLGQTICTSQHKNVCVPKESFEELTPVTRHSRDDLSTAVRLQLAADAIETENMIYREPQVYHDQQVDAIMARLSEDDLAEVCVGAGVGGMMSTKKIVALGTVGRTTDKLYRKGLINVNLSDGPAGLRLLKRAAIRGRLRMVDYLMGFMEFMPKNLLRFLMANPKKDTTLYQFTTAFPVGTALAQTWNQPLCEEIGQAISAEMEEYYVTYWLAPALNIHRNPLCGRNFEYFSEDPVLSGRISAGLTRGVQSIAGNYVTIKHFACNNQEDNRNRSNSILSERALREIYLKGFEITIRESAPKAVMTSYNLINGVYAPNCRELITDILRSEWGFDGVVMTDWFSTGKELADNALAIAAGNDMIMPGGGSYKKQILQGLKSGKLTLPQLQCAAANIIRSIVHSSVARKFKPEDFES